MKNRSVWWPRISQIWGVVTMVGLVAAIAVLSGPRSGQAHPPCNTGGGYYGGGGVQVYGPAGVRGQARRVSRRTARRVSRR